MAELTKTPEKVLKELKEGKYAPIYFLSGEEPYYIDSISDFIEANCLPESEKGFNQTILYGKDTNVSTIIQNARKFPMFSERQVVVVKEAQDIGDLLKEDSEKMLTAYLQNPSPTTVLVFCYKYKKLDARKKITKTIQQHSVFIESKKIYDNQLGPWINELVKERGYKIDAKATILLVESIGVDLSRISNELEKLFINIKSPDETINENMVEKYIGVSKEYNVFELQRAIGRKDIMTANKIVNYFMSGTKGSFLIPMIGALYSYYTKLLLLHSAKENNPDAAARLIGVNSFFVKEYITAKDKLGWPACVRAISALREADKMIKGYNYPSMDEGWILKELVFKLIH